MGYLCKFCTDGGGMKKYGDSGKTREPKPSGLAGAKSVAATKPETKR